MPHPTHCDCQYNSQLQPKQGTNEHECFLYRGSHLENPAQYRHTQRHRLDRQSDFPPFLLFLRLNAMHVEKIKNVVLSIEWQEGDVDQGKRDITVKPQEELIIDASKENRNDCCTKWS